MGGATGAGQGQCVMELLPTCGQQVMELPVWPGRLVRELLRAAVGRVWELCTNTPTGLKLKMETTLGTMMAALKKAATLLLATFAQFGATQTHFENLCDFFSISLCTKQGKIGLLLVAVGHPQDCKPT